MSRAPANFRQQDVSRAIKAAKNAGLDIVRVEIEPKTAKIVLVIKSGEKLPLDTSWDDAAAKLLGREK